MKYYLLIDTTKYNKFAITTENELLLEKTFYKFNEKDWFSFSLYNTLQELKIKPNIIGINVGPGSFTGIRIGISLVKAIAFANKIPVIITNSFEIMENYLKKIKIPLPDPIIAIHSHKNFYYVKQENKIEYLASENIDTSKIVIGNIRCEDFNKCIYLPLSMEEMFSVIIKKEGNGNYTDLHGIMPFYVKEFIPKVKKKKL